MSLDGEGVSLRGSSWREACGFVVAPGGRFLEQMEACGRGPFMELT